ncbi:MAG TPA: BamA/TamA family outer membrane protein [Chitinophagaceae bacterium]|nr:BamA/TamA family outer membrane protein [Chitinophagaceae bacterium]
MNKRQHVYIYPLLLLTICSCSNLKYLPAGESLYTGAKVVLNSSGRTDVKPKNIRAELEGLTRPRPNKKILGLRFKLWVYNIAGHPKKESSLRGKLKYKVGEPPVLLSDVNLDFNVKVLASNLQNRGFLQAAVTADTVVKNRKGTAVYTAVAGSQYTIKEVQFEKDSSLLSKTIAEASPNTFLKTGRPYNLDVIKAERERIDAYLKEKGFYYFNPDFLYVSVDSSIGNHAVNLGVNKKPLIPEQSKNTYVINDIFIFSNYRLNTAAGDTIKNAAVNYKGYQIVDKQHLYKPQMFDRMMLFSPGDPYKRSSHNLTLNRLITLGLFKFVKNRFELAPQQDTPKLNTFYYLTPMPKKSLRVELIGSTKSNNLTGSQISTSWRNRNTFRAGELLTITALGGFEVQYSGQYAGFNTYRGGLEANLAIPRFVVPFLNLNTKGGFVPKTNILLGYDLINKQKLYTLNSFRASYGYVWKENVQKEHQLNPVSITYVQPVNVTDIYRAAIDTNPTLQKAIDKQFILGSNYSYIYNPLTGNAVQTGIYFNGNLDLSGNIAGLVSGANVRTGKEKTIFNAAFSQYIRADIDLRYYLKVGTNSVWANRLIVGVGYPYGNSSSLPFIKQFFIGGNNSLRAFRSRSLGPGTYLGARDSVTKFFPEQSGDIKLEMNTEYRMKLVSVVNGAVFVDAGNIWLYNKDPLKPGAEFTNQFMSQLAVGGGVGLRVDVSFLVLRLDVAFPLRKPWLPQGQRWVLNQIDFTSSTWRKDNLILNIAIGYPF